MIILKHLHKAAVDYSRLLVMESVVSHACHDLGGADHDAVTGAYPLAFPAPLPANGGLANESRLALDISVRDFDRLLLSPLLIKRHIYSCSSC